MADTARGGPLRHPLFRAIWVAGLVSNVGTWMHDVGASWLMTSLAPSYLMVALIQAATSLPLFLFALPAGALADIVDRRRLLIVTQLWMLAAAATLGALTLAGQTGPWTLLLFTALLGVGGALMGPAWQAIIPEVVPRTEVPAAIALGGVSINLSRIAGPAIGGLIVAAAGPWAVFVMNAVSFLAVAGVLYRWKREPPDTGLPPEHMVGAITAGVRYVRHTPALRAVLIRAGAYILFASAFLALLPLLAREQLKLQASGYGVLMGCMGGGAVLGSALLPRLRARFGASVIVACASLLVAVTLMTLASVRLLPVLYVAVALGGMAWASNMITFNVAVVGGVPAWVR